MSMRHYPGSGYLVAEAEIRELVKTHLSPKEFKKYKDLLDECEYDDAYKIIYDIFKTLGFVLPKSYIDFNDGDDFNDDLNRYCMYLYFDSDDLFEKVPTEGNKKLSANNIIPKEHVWFCFV